MVTEGAEVDSPADEALPERSSRYPQWWRTGAATGRPALVPLTYLVAAFALTFRLWADPAGSHIAGNPHDIDLYTWWIGWWPHAIATGQDPFISTALNVPTGVSAMSNTSLALPSLAFGWLTALAGPLVTYNVLSLLAPASAASAAYLCARRLGVHALAAYPAGLVFGFAPAMTHSMLGHLSMAFAALLPVLIYLGVRACTTDRPRRTGLMLGIAAFAQLLTGEEVLFQAGVGTLVVVLALIAARPRLVARQAPTALATYGYALAVFLPLAAYPLYQQFFGRLRQHGSPFSTDYYSADLLAFTTPPEQVMFGDPAGATGFTAGITEHLAFLGWPLLLFCLWTMYRRWDDIRVRAAGLGLTVAAVLSMGTMLWVRGQQTTQPMPWSWFAELPVLENAIPTRFGLLAVLFAAALLAVGLDATLRSPHEWPARTLAATTVAAVVVTLFPVPFAVEPGAPAPAYFTRQARELPRGTTALVAPFPTAINTEPMRWQAAARYRFSMPGGFFIGPSWDGHAYVGGGPGGPIEGLLGDLETKGVAPELTADRRAAMAADLAAMGIDIVLLGPTPRRELIRQALIELLGQPVEVNGVDVWDEPRVRR